MDLSIKALEQITNPLEVVNLLGRTLNKNDNGYYNTTCPKCESKLYLLDKEFVCENNSCTFRAGSVPDYIVASEGCKWEEVLDILDVILDNRLQATTIYKNRKPLCALLKNKRKLFDFFLRMGLQGSTPNMGVMQYRNAIRSQGIDPDYLRWSVFVTSAAESSVLSDLVTKVSGTPVSSIKDVSIILPYFSNYHTISHLLVLHSPTAKPEKIPVSPRRISYFGLLQRHPTCEHTKMAYTYADCAKLNTQYARLSPENVCLHTLLDAKSEGVSFSPKEAQYVVTDDQYDNMRAVAMLQRHIPKLTVDKRQFNIYQDNTDSPASTYLVECLLSEVKKGTSIASALELVDLSTAARQDLLSKLHLERHFDAAEAVRNYFRTLPVYNDDKATLYSNPYGYTLKKHGGESHTSYVTNFTVELEQNIVFAETTDIFHAGNVVFNGENYPFIIKQDELERVAELEKAVRRSTISSQPTVDENSMPTIKERSVAKYLTTYLRNQIAGLPRAEGLPLLGWSPRRTSFYAPYFIADKNGLRKGKKYFHPHVGALNNYTTDLDDVAQLFHDLPSDMVTVLNQAAAFIVRSYLGMPVRPVAIYNSTEARSLLSGLFASIGQISISQLNQNIRGEELPGIRGFPYYAVGYSYAQVSKSSLPAFILCDAGLNIENIFTPDEISRGKRTLKFIVQKTVEWAISTSAVNFKQAHSVSRDNAYSMEGSNIVLDACGLLTWPSSHASPFENLDKMLSNISFDEVKQYFVKDINRHILQIKKSAVGDVDVAALEKELQSISKKVDITASSIDVDSESMLEALTNFYHNKPTLTDVFNVEELAQKLNLSI